MPNFDDIMNRSFGSGDTPYSQEEIDAALKRQKKLGGTLLENLRELTGRSMKTSFDLEKEIARLNENLKLDFNMNQEALLENAAYAGVLPASETETQDVTAAEAAYPTLKGADAFPSGSVKVSGSAEDFDDVTEKLSGRVFGQNEFIRKLVIAFKRPFVMPEKDGHARNSMYLTGPEDTGKHLALYELADMLFDKKLLTSREIRVIDLSLYANAGADNIFLQDLYTALRSMANILLFENFDACHISYLSYLTELVSTGKCRLSGRYVLQKGQLVNVSNSFASETVSSFSAAGKYLVFVSTKGVSKLADVLGAGVYHLAAHLQPLFRGVPGEVVAQLTADEQARFLGRIQGGHGGDDETFQRVLLGLEAGEPIRRFLEALDRFVQMRVAVRVETHVARPYGLEPGAVCAALHAYLVPQVVVADGA